MDRKTEVRRPSPWLTPAEAATYLGIELGTLRNWVSQRRIPFVRRGRVVRLHERELDEWLRVGQVQPEDHRARSSRRQKPQEQT